MAADQHVAVRVEVDLPAHQFCAGIMADRDEHAGDREADSSPVMVLRSRTPVTSGPPSTAVTWELVRT